MNFTPELGRLLRFTAESGCSAYNQGDIDDLKQFAPEDILWLSDCLHSFGLLGDAVLGGNVEQINFACDMLTNSYRDYSVDRQTTGLVDRHLSETPTDFHYKKALKYSRPFDGKRANPLTWLPTIKNAGYHNILMIIDRT